MDWVKRCGAWLVTSGALRIVWSWRFKETGARVKRWNYFDDAEVQGLDIELVAMLDRARGLAGFPFTITSGLRTQEKNDSLPASVKDSSHLTGNGVDLACSESPERFAMLRGLILAGFKRIGIYAGHIHCDNSSTLPPNVCWYSHDA